MNRGPSLPRLAVASLWNRRSSVLLTALAIAISVALLLGVQLVRHAARSGFQNTVSGIDLVVGARTGELNLLLSSVFRLGAAPTGISQEIYQRVTRHRDVAWTIPLQLGDSHRGFRVIGTTPAYFEHYRYGDSMPLRAASGNADLQEVSDVVLGAEVAAKLGYRIGEPIVISHGVGAVSFHDHDEHPLRVAGILAPTGTPVDRSVHVTLEALALAHGQGEGEDEAAHAAGVDVSTTPLSAFLVGMKDRTQTFTMQRALNEYRGEAVLAILPGVALSQLWELVGLAETALSVVAAFVAVAGLLGMQAVILAGLNERRREMAILRSVGASPRHVFGLLVAEAGTLALAGTVAGALATAGLWFALKPLAQARLGFSLASLPPAGPLLGLLAAVLGAALLMGLVPAIGAYRRTLADGLTMRT
jgi:putative ABC transport system permease protein